MRHGHICPPTGVKVPKRQAHACTDADARGREYNKLKGEKFMNTKITFTSINRNIFEKRVDVGKIKAIKAIRATFKIGLQHSKQIADVLWASQMVTDDTLPRADKDGQAILREYGVHIAQPDAHISLEVRLMQLVKAAIRDGEPRLAASLLGVYNDHFVG